MIKPTRTMVGVGAAAAGALAWGSAKREPAAVALGLAGLLGAALAWKAADEADVEATRHPELMNGHFLTQGRASATSGDPVQIAELGDIMIRRGRRRLAHRL